MEDTGVGIKEEDKGKLFKLFGFMKSGQKINPKGIGLGLNISQKIVKMFDGDIICRSEYGKGTNFIFVVALGQQSDTHSNKESSQRILNPILRQYQKIKLVRLKDQIVDGCDQI